MRFPLIGAVISMAAALWGATTADAQIKIEGAGPLSISSYDTSTVYTADVTWTGTFKWKVRALLNGVAVATSSLYTVSSSGPVTQVDFTFNDINSWGMQAGDTVTFHGFAMVTLSNKDNDYMDLEVQGYGMQLTPPEALPLPSPRVETLYAAVLRDEENQA